MKEWSDRMDWPDELPPPDVENTSLVDLQAALT
jgi:hypothetical protein